MKRWHEERNLMLRRLREENRARQASLRLWSGCGPVPFGHSRDWRSDGVGDDLRGPGLMRKRRPHDCGKPRCEICHGHKLVPKARANQRRAAVAFELAAEES